MLKNKVVVSNMDWTNAVWSGVTLRKTGDDHVMFFTDTEISVTVSVVSGFLKISLDIPARHQGQMGGKTLFASVCIYIIFNTYKTAINIARIYYGCVIENELHLLFCLHNYPTDFMYGSPVSIVTF